MTEPIRVALPDRPYDIVVGAGLLDELPARLPVPPHARRAAVVTNAAVAALYEARVVAGLQALGLDVQVVNVPDGEEAKSVDTLAMLWRRSAAAPLNRDDVVVALG